MTGRANVVLLTLLLEASSGVRTRLRREEGQAFVEYALVLLLALAFFLAAFVTFRTGFEDAITGIADAISGTIP